MPEMMSNASGPVRPGPVIDSGECKGCERCVNACPAKCLRMSDALNWKGSRFAEYIGEGCTGCGICFYNCPEPYTIRIEKPGEKR
jgi:NAD-dependent dihydropyrimidine dehydrogenase PreA subunit